MTDTQRQKLRDLALEIVDDGVDYSLTRIALWLHDALRIIAEEETPNLGAASMTITDAMLKRMVETGVDPKTLVIKSQMKDGVYRTWVDQEEPEHIGTVKLGKPRPLEPVSDTYKSDGWIQWGGGLPPVEDHTVVDVKYRNGEIRLGMEAYQLGWCDIYDQCSIIAYRIAQPAPQPLNAPPPDDMPCWKEGKT